MQPYRSKFQEDGDQKGLGMEIVRGLIELFYRKESEIRNTDLVNMKEYPIYVSQVVSIAKRDLLDVVRGDKSLEDTITKKIADGDLEPHVSYFTTNRLKDIDDSIIVLSSLQERTKSGIVLYPTDVVTRGVTVEDLMRMPEFSKEELAILRKALSDFDLRNFLSFKLGLWDWTPENTILAIFPTGGDLYGWVYAKDVAAKPVSKIQKTRDLKKLAQESYKSKFQEAAALPPKHQIIQAIKDLFMDIADHEIGKLYQVGSFPMYLMREVEELAEKGKLTTTPTAVNLDEIAKTIGTRDLQGHINYVIKNKMMNWGIAFLRKESVSNENVIVLNKFEEGSFVNVNLYNPVTMQIYLDGNPHMLVDMLGALSDREINEIGNDIADRVNWGSFLIWYEDYKNNPQNSQVATHISIKTGGNFYAWLDPKKLMETVPEKTKIGKVRDLKKLAQESVLIDMQPYKSKFIEAKKPAPKTKFPNREELVNSIIQFFNDTAEHTKEYVQDTAGEYEYLILEEAERGRVNIGNTDNEILAPLTDKFGTREEVSKEIARQLKSGVLRLHSGFLPMDNYNNPEFPNDAVVFNYVDETEHEEQIDLHDSEITVSGKMAQLKDALSALTEEERSKVERDVEDIYLRDTWEDIDAGKDSIWVYVNCDGAICFWVMIDDVLGGGKAVNKISKTKALKKLAQESTKPYTRLFSTKTKN